MELLSKSCLNVVLKTDRNVRQTERHNLLLEMSISYLEKNLTFVLFQNFHLLMSNDYIMASNKSI